MDFNKLMSEEELINAINQCDGNVNWGWISKYQKLSESFIEKFSDKVNWWNISANQRLSESFIKKFSDKVNWPCISEYQKLSETFIEKFSDKVDWNYISQYQKLSESFIREFSDKVDWDWISEYQTLSQSFIKEHKLTISEHSWLYLSGDEKLAKVKESKLYDIEGDYVLAYKGIRSDRYSNFNFQYQYLEGETYECHADFNNDNESSFGLSAWTLEEATKYCNQLVVKVKIHKDDLAALVHNGGKIRCQKFTILENVA